MFGSFFYCDFDYAVFFTNIPSFEIISFRFFFQGELWAEKSGFFGLKWQYYTCMESQVWEINEWARCQRKNLKHIKADSHLVMYRLVAGAGDNANSNGSTKNKCDEDHHNAGGPGPADVDNWDSLINNLCKGSSGSTKVNGNSHFNNDNLSTTAKKRKGKRK